MKTPKLVKGYIIFELVMVVVFGYLLTPAEGANVFLLGPRAGLMVAVASLFLNPVIGIVGLFISGSEIYKKNRTALIITLFALSALFATLFPIAFVEREVSQLFSVMIVR